MPQSFRCIGETDLVFATGPVSAPQINPARSRPGRYDAETLVRFSDIPCGEHVSSGSSRTLDAMFFTAGISRDIVTRLNGLITKALQSQEVREFMKREVLDPVVSTPEELSDLMKRETAKYAEVIRKGNIKLE